MTLRILASLFYWPGSGQAFNLFCCSLTSSLLLLQFLITKHVYRPLFNIIYIHTLVTIMCLHFLLSCMMAEECKLQNDKRRFSRSVVFHPTTFLTDLLLLLKSLNKGTKLNTSTTSLFTLLCSLRELLSYFRFTSF